MPFFVLFEFICSVFSFNQKLINIFFFFFLNSNNASLSHIISSCLCRLGNKAFEKISESYVCNI